MKVIVAGSRNCTDYELVAEAIDLGITKLDIEITEINSGGSKGVEVLAEEWASNNGANYIKFPIKWKNLKVPNAVVKEGAYGSYNANAGRDCNQKLVDNADAIIAIDLNSRDTMDIIKRAKKADILIYEYTPAGALTDEEFGYNFGSGLDG